MYKLRVLYILLPQYISVVLYLYMYIPVKPHSEAYKCMRNYSCAQLFPDFMGEVKCVNKG